MEDKKMKLRLMLAQARSERFPLVFVVPGSGQIARYAIDGGAHFLMVLNAGLYRMAGVTSLASFMPFGNANDQVEELLVKQILPRSQKVPVVAGVMPNDPLLPLGVLFRRLKDLGVTGIANWPAVGLIDGKFREALEEEGFTIEAEVEMLKEAKRNGFVTFGFVLSVQDASIMTTARVDAMIINLGWTHETHNIYEKSDRLQYAVKVVNGIIDVVTSKGEDPLFLFFGGTVTSPEDTSELYQRTRLHGYGGGSSFEAIPVAKLITNRVKEFCSVPRQSKGPAFGEGMGRMIGSSPAMLKLYRLIARVAPYDVHVCIQGESGSGKELVANQIHQLSGRASQPFITLNCGAIPDSLIESELFGHEKGAFTGAVSRRLGKFDLADRGVLFLDEVAELSPKAQVSLLRAIQQKEIFRLGGEKAIPVDVRIITATHQNLKEMVQQGRFRTDLYFRLSIINIDILPLRERINDIPALVMEFLHQLGSQFNRHALGVTPDFMKSLMEYSWPGNVRELKHVLCRALLMEDSSILEGEYFLTDHLRPKGENNRSSFVSVTGRLKTKEAEDNALLNALKFSNGNKKQAAVFLGISRKTLYSRLKRMKAAHC